MAFGGSRRYSLKQVVIAAVAGVAASVVLPPAINPASLLHNLVQKITGGAK